MTEPDTLDRELNSYVIPLLTAGGGALALCLLGSAVFGLERALGAYLFAFCFWSSISIGSIGALMFQYLVDAYWGMVGRRVFEASASLIPLVALLFLPVLLGASVIYDWYPWSKGQFSAAHHLALLEQNKTWYLNFPFWAARNVAYFGFWCLSAWFLIKCSRRREESLNPEHDARAEAFSGPGLWVFVMTATYGGMDWGMSLEPHWTSTMYGVLWLVGQGLVTWSFTVMVLHHLRHQPSLSRVMTMDRFHDFGNLLLSFTMLWAYMSISQYLLIWWANMPEEVEFFIHRQHGAWMFLSRALVVFHFAVPFLILLSRTVKRNSSTLVKVAGFIFLVRTLDLWFYIGPAIHRDGFYLPILEILAWIGVGGIWLAAFCKRLPQAPLVPRHILDELGGEAHAH